MKEFKYTITDPEGIHARPAGELVKAAKQFTSTIKLAKDGKSGDCKKIFGYQYSEIIRSLMSVYFCGGSCVEDVTSHLMRQLKHVILRI